MIGPKTTLTLERRGTVTADGQGGGTLAWQGLRTISGVLSTMDEHEMQYAGRMAAEATHVFGIDYPVGVTITTRDRFRKQTRVFEITGTKDKDQQQKRLKIYLKETT